MAVYQQIVAHLLAQFEQINIELIPRAQNSHADALTWLATSEGAAELSDISITRLVAPSTIDFIIASLGDQQQDSWMTLIFNYLLKGALPHNSVEANRLRIRAARYTIIRDQLYMRGFSLPLLKCLTKKLGELVLREIHGGVCGNHTGGLSLALKAIRQGYYWPHLRRDAIKLARSCHKGPYTIIFFISSHVSLN
ncbi:hypothetical protein ACS0TY_014224 [Phlomoides rotata]